MSLTDLIGRQRDQVPVYASGVTGTWRWTSSASRCTAS
jgi:hypothetical protein